MSKGAMTICSPSVVFKSHGLRTLSIVALLATVASAFVLATSSAVDASGVPPAFLTPPSVKMIVGTLNTYMPVVNDNLVVVEQGPLPNEVTFTNGTLSGTPVIQGLGRDAPGRHGHGRSVASWRQDGSE